MYLGIGQMYLGIGLAVSERDRLQGYSLKKPAIVTFDLRRSFHSNLSFGHWCPMSSATRTRLGCCFANIFQQLSNDWSLFFDVCFSMCQPRGVTAKDVCRRRWILQRILLCHCDPIVPPVSLWEAAHSAAREQNHNSGMTTHTVKVLYISVLCPCQFSIWTQAVEEHKFWSKFQSFFHLCIQTTLDTCFASFMVNFWYPEVTAFQKGHLTLCLNEVLGSDTMKISRKEEDCTLRLVAAAAAYISVLYRGQVSWTWFQQDSSRPSSSGP